MTAPRYTSARIETLIGDARKTLYEKLHPETKKGAAGGEATRAKHKGKAKSQDETQPPDAFVDDTAKNKSQDETCSAPTPKPEREPAPPAPPPEPEQMPVGTGCCLPHVGKTECPVRTPPAPLRGLALLARIRSQANHDRRKVAP